MVIGARGAAGLPVPGRVAMGYTTETGRARIPRQEMEVWDARGMQRKLSTAKLQIAVSDRGSTDCLNIRD